jgi:5'(3')-deoxyribonucleotidase
MRNPDAIIYSDSDGVICDFKAGAAKILGHPWHPGRMKKAEQGYILTQHEKFWETLPPMPDWEKYWNFIQKYNPHILTAVPSEPWPYNFEEVERGKREWYKHHIPSLPQSHIHVVYRENKRNFARSGQVQNILIDDHLENVQEFREAGGIGILHHNAKSTIVQLRDLGYH